MGLTAIGIIYSPWGKQSTEEDYDKVLDFNLKDVFFAAQEFVRHLRATEGRGKIVNVSSAHEELPFPNFTAYCASKGGVKMLTRNLAVELGPLGIKGVAVFLASDDADYVTGSTYYVDGGLTWNYEEQ